MSISESVPVEVEELLAELPAFALLPEEVRALVAESFDVVEFAFGASIVEEGDSADAFFVLSRGTARVIKKAENGQEVSLNVLSRGDAFGEAGLLGDAKRTATVRASSQVEALRLHASVFAAISRSYPEVRTMFETIARTRTLSDFLRTNPAFESLPGEALAQMIAGLEPVDVAAGDIVIREGDPPGAMYVVEEGRLRAFREQDVGYLRTGDFFGERSLFRNEPRTASIEAVTEAKLLRLPEPLYATLLAENSAFRERMQERIQQYDYQRIARVPLDFADEILPAEASAADIDEELPKAPEPEGVEELDEAAARPHKKPGRRFPHIFQLDEMDCGAACLAMVCRFYGRAVALPHIREIAHTGVRGTSLNGITRAAQQLGLEARSIRASKSRLDEMPLPAVVHWEGDHWIVLYQVGKKHVRVADPESGLRKYKREFFLEHWTGYASVIDYGEGLMEQPEAKPNIGWIAPFLKPHTRLLVIATLLAALAAGLELVLPIVTQHIVDSVLRNPDHAKAYHELWVLTLAMCAVLLAMTVASLIQRYLLSRVAVRFDISALDHLTKTLLDLPMSYFSTRRTGDIERRLSGARSVRQFITTSGVAVLTAGCQLAAALTLMFIYNWQLALLYLLTVPMYAGLMRYSSTRLRPLYDDLEASYGRYSSGQIDAIRGIETVKAVAAEDSLRRAMLGRFTTLANRIFRTQFIVLTYNGLLQLVSLISFALFLVVGSVEVISGNMTLGQYFAFNALIALANGPVMSLLGLWDDMQQTRVQLMRLDDVLGQEPEQGRDRSHLREVTTLEGRVELRNVGFRYGGPDAAPILEGLSFSVEPGQTIAVVGRSGSGKTTLIKLLAGLLEPTEGTVLYDGYDMKTLDYRTLRRQIGFVLQENYLFNDSITGNISFGDEEEDAGKLLTAAKAANAHEFITRLPLAYDTRVGESGLRLSGGQQQRVAIARALYHRPPILLFDEATSALDAESERAVKQSLDELLVGRTSFVIAHRLSTIRDADRILVLERGRLVEDGTHDELIAREGLYYYLSSQQLEM